MPHFNTWVLCRLAILQALLGTVVHVMQTVGTQAAYAVSFDPRATRRQGLGFSILRGCGGGGCREGPAYASAFSSFSSAVIHMASARSSASRSSAYFFCQMCSSSLRSS